MAIACFLDPAARHS